MIRQGRHRRLCIALGLVALSLVTLSVSAQTNVRIRGTITAVSGNTLDVKSRDGRDLKIQLADNVAVAVAKAIRFDEIKVGDYVGATTKPGPDGVHVAVEVHYLAATTPEGQLAWDLMPGSTMTNANVASAKVEAAGNHELMLKYKGGEQRIVVPPTAALVRAEPGTRADLKVGEYVFIGAQQAADGALSAARVQVSKDGVKPPQ
jgi:hypothetical protein